MCLAIPGKIVELLARRTRPGGGRRSGRPPPHRSRPACATILPSTGDWVLIHVGFAMSKISEVDALDQLRMLTELGESESAMEEVQGYGLGTRKQRQDRTGDRETRRAMRFVDEFREPELITRTADEIRRLADPDRHYRFMEVCGGHTHAIYRFGLMDLLPPNIELVHGPGCPVCVLPMGRIDDGLSIAEDPASSSLRSET